MTVPTTDSCVQYTGTGTTPTYTVPFKFFSDEDLVVEQLAADGTITALGLTADYTLVGAGRPTGGTLTLTAGNLASGVILVIARDPEAVQDTSLPDGGPYFGSAIEAQLDELTMQVQAARRLADNSIRFPLVESLAGLVSELPSALERAGTLLGFDANGNVTNTAQTVSLANLTQVSNVAALRVVATPANGTVYATGGYYATGDKGAAIYTWNATDVTADNSGTVIAITGVVTGRFNLRYSGSIDVRWFGAKGDGTTDDTIAVRAAVTACPTGGSVTIPDGSFRITSSITSSGKDITILLIGKILDRATTWTNNYADLTLTGKGLFAFTGGIISIIGCGLTHIDGGRAVGGVDQTARALLYFYNCTGVTIQDIRSIKGLGSTVATYLCTNIVHCDCLHDQGEFAVLHSRATDVLVEGVRVTNALYNGITVLNRGGFINAVLPFQASDRVKVLGCSTYSVTSVNNYAVGITVDNCTNFTVANCAADGAGVGTMAFSFAGSSYGVVVGNRCKGMSNIANGAYTYAGIGMECDTVTQVEFIRNHFRSTLLGYLILVATDCTFDGNYFCDEGRSSSVVTGAGQCAYINLNNAVTPSARITISGIVDGGSYVFAVLGTYTDVTIRDMRVYDYFFRFWSVATGSVTRLTVHNLQIYLPGAAKDVFVNADNLVAGVKMSDVIVEAVTAPGTSKRLWFGESVAGVYHFSRCFVKNFDAGLLVDRYDRVARVTVRDCHFSGVAGTLLSIAGASVKVAMEGCTLDNVGLQVSGNNAAMIFTTAAPLTTPVFIGQYCLDTTNFKLYVAKGIASSADWTILN